MAARRLPARKKIESPVQSVEASIVSSNSSNPFTTKRIAIGLLIGILVVLAVYKKGVFIAATVNGRPITTIQLISRLNQNYRNQELDNMVTERVILDEAKKKNLLPTDQEIKSRVADVEKRYGGKDAFDSLVSQQGQTRSMVEDQLKVQLAFEKLYSNEATVSDQEIDDFIKQNKAQLPATDSATQRQEATNAIKQRKLSQVSLQKLDELKKNANIKIF